MSSDDAEVDATEGEIPDVRVDPALGLAARAGVGAAAVVGAGVIASGVAIAAVTVAALCCVGLAADGLRRAPSRWQEAAGHLSDVLMAGLCGGLVAGAGGAAVGAAGAATALALAATVAYERGWLAGTRVAAAALALAAVGALTTGHAMVLAALGVLAGLGAWLVWAGERAFELAAGVAAQHEDLRRVRAEMVTTVSHELRTPLTVIQGAMTTLSRRWDVLSEPERLDLIDVLIDNVASLDSSILHFVDAARLERGDLILTAEWVDVAAVIDRLCTKLATVLAGRDIQTELLVNNVWADPTALSRILEHLLVNAVRFSPIGLPIKVRVSTQGSETVISVADRGQGIAPRLLPRVWEPLERGDVSETGVSRGAGLGLPIVRELAELHGGEASLTSRKGHGTTVTVRLPLPAGHDVAAAQEPVRAPRRLRRRAGLRK